MTFESRTINSDDGFELSVLAEGNTFTMLSLKYNEDYMDNEDWLKKELYLALWAYLRHKVKTRHEEALTESQIAPKDYLEIYEMLCKAEALGWMKHIK